MISLSLIKRRLSVCFAAHGGVPLPVAVTWSHPRGWTANPQYALNVSSGTDVQIALERPASKWARFNKTHTLEAMMGVYVLRGTAPGAKVNSPEKAFAHLTHTLTQHSHTHSHTNSHTHTFHHEEDDALVILLVLVSGVTFSIGDASRQAHVKRHQRYGSSKAVLRRQRPYKVQHSKPVTQALGYQCGNIRVLV